MNRNLQSRVERLLAAAAKETEKPKRRQALRKIGECRLYWVLTAVGVLFLIVLSVLAVSPLKTRSVSRAANAAVPEGGDGQIETGYNPRLSPYSAPSSLTSAKKGGDVLKTALVTVKFRKSKPSGESVDDTEHGRDEKRRPRRSRRERATEEAGEKEAVPSDYLGM